MIVVDMQVGLLNGPPKHDLPGVLDRINQLTAMVRRRSGKVLWIQHCGTAGDDFEPKKPGWSLLPELNRHPTDVVVDFCVDATVRSSVSHNHHVVVISDAHTLSDRPHLDAPTVIRHHNWVWANLITTRSIRMATTSELLDEN